MHIDDIKRGLRAEIKKRENEQYATFECNVRQMCKDVLAKLEEQESEIIELKAENGRLKLDKRNQELRADITEAKLRHQKYERCVALSRWCDGQWDWYANLGRNFDEKRRFFGKWGNRWLALADKFKEDEDAH